MQRRLHAGAGDAFEIAARLRAASQASTRCSPMPSMISSRIASPIDFSSTVRNGGVNIWPRALKASSNMAQK